MRITEEDRQYIADVYHCSGCWGQRTTAEEMRVNLNEWNLEKGPDDYCPDPSTAAACAAYWNQLCEKYPS